MMLPSPSGTHIAIVSVTGDDTASTITLSTIGVVKPQIHDYFTSTPTQTSGTAIFAIDGWSSDSRFLAFSAVTATGDSQKANIGITDFTTGQTILLGEQITGDLIAGANKWGPQDLFAFSSRERDQSTVNIYDPKAAKFTAWPVAAKSCWVDGFIDSTHLVYRSSADNTLYIMDMSNGGSVLSPKHPPILKTAANDPLQGDTILPASGNPLTLTLDPTDVNAVSRDSVSHPQNVVTVWVSVQGIPFFSRSSRSVNYLAVDSFMVSDSSAVSAQFIPHQVKASTSQVALLVNGNLYISTLTFGPSSIQEALDAGDQVPCSEEQQLASSDLKEIGLGILQYTEDYDNMLPRNSDFHDEVYPYIKSESVFTVGKYKATFSLDGEDIASFDSPATTIAETITLPCAKVVLYLDGHVQSYPLQSTKRETQHHGAFTLKQAGRSTPDCGCRV